MSLPGAKSLLKRSHLHYCWCKRASKALSNDLPEIYFVRDFSLRFCRTRVIRETSSGTASGFRKKSSTPARHASFSHSSPESMMIGIFRRCAILRTRRTNSNPLNPGRSLSTINRSYRVRLLSRSNPVVPAMQESTWMPSAVRTSATNLFTVSSSSM